MNRMEDVDGDDNFPLTWRIWHLYTEFVKIGSTHMDLGRQ